MGGCRCRGALICCTGVLALTPATAWAGDGTFTTPAASPADVIVGTGPYGMATGDLNVDGRMDLAVTNTVDNNISIRLGRGDGSFDAAASLGSVGDSEAVAISNVNGDRFPDLLATDTSGNHVDVRIGDGDGTFANPPPAVVPVGNFPRRIVTGDFNGDGNEDFATGNLVADTVSIRLGQGDGTFAQSAELTAVGDTRMMATGDLDNDGDLDLAIANGQASPNMVVRLQTAPGVFSNATTLDFPIPGTVPTGLVVADLDGDRVEDLAVTEGAGHRVFVLAGKGDGTFTAKPPISLGANSLPVWLALADFNSDDNADLATSNFGGDSNSILLGAGDGTFSSPQTVAAGDVPRNMVVADLNNDGNDDIATANQGHNDVSVRLGLGPPTLTGNLLTNGGFEAGAAVGQPAAPAPPAISGWQRVGNITAARYGMRASNIFPDVLSSPRFGTGGLNFLFGGAGPGPGDATAHQDVDVSSSSASIDAGLATARVSAYLGGGSVFDDRMSASALFLDASATQLGSLTIGPVSAADRKNLTTLLKRVGSASIPAGTRQIRVALTATNIDTGGSSAFADNVKLTVAAPEPPRVEPPPPPEDPPDVTDTTAPETSKGKGPKRRSRKRTARFRFSSEPGASFECKLDKRAFAPCTSPHRVRRLKPRRHLFLVRAVDAAGNVEATPVKFRFRVLRPKN